MATEAGTPNPELNALFEKLIEPFDPSEIKWRVTHTTRDGKKGAVLPYVDQRAYTDRLNRGSVRGVERRQITHAKPILENQHLVVTKPSQNRP